MGLSILVPDPYIIYIGCYLAGLALAIGLGAILHAQGRGRAPAERLALLLCPPAAYITLTLVAFKVIQSPDFDWNSARLAPLMGLLHGSRLYVGPNGPGAVMNTIYPPLAYLPYLPACLFSDPTSAIIAGSCISVALYFAPAILLCFSRRRNEAGRFSIVGLVILLGFIQVSLTSKGVIYSAFGIHADAPMLSFVGIACLALHLGRGDSTPALSTCLSSAAFAAMAVWSKQTAAPMIAALPIWVLMTHGFRASLRYALCLVATVATVSFLCRTAFGINALMFNMFMIPSKHPWKYQGPELAKGLLLLATDYFFVAALLVASILLVIIARRQLTPTVPTESEPGGLRVWLGKNHWLLFVVMAVSAIPTSLLSAIKVGGYWNNYAPTPYFLALGLSALLLEWHATNRRRGLGPFNAALTLTLLFLVLTPLTKCSEDNFLVFKSIHAPSANVQDVAFQYAKQYPGVAYFPWNPLSNLLAEGKLYHFEYGLFDRELAGFPIRPGHFRRHVPPNMRYVCFPPHYRGLGYPFEVPTMKYLPDFSHRVEIRELPGWTCYERVSVAVQ